MKIFFDRLSDLLQIKKDLGKQLKGKSTAIISTGATKHLRRSFEEVFTNSFNYLSMDYKGLLYCYCEEHFILNEHEDYIKHQINQIQKLN